MNDILPTAAPREAATTRPATHGATLPPRRRYWAGAAFWSLCILYGSLAIGPAGFNFQPLPLAEAWSRFLDLPYVLHGSDQRADWIGNLVFLVPFGYALMGALWPRGHPGSRWVGAAAAFLISVAFVLVVKFAQLYVPPRTVTLNYVYAQSLGALAGIALFWLLSTRISRLVASFLSGGRGAVTAILAIYSIWLLLFFLVPFDFVLNGGDVSERLAVLPHLFLTWPGENRPMSARAVLLIADTLAASPLGMLLALRAPDQSIRRIAATGFGIMAAVTFATMFVISATPFLPAILYRTAGIAAGAAAARRLERQDPQRLRRLLTRSVPYLVLPYLAAVLFINGLITRQWLTPAEALDVLDWRTLLPFWNFYIVSKAHAEASLAVHVATFAPVGLMLWLRRGSSRSGPFIAAALAALLSALVETGRAFQPGLRPDISDVFVAAVAAWAAFAAAPFLARGDDPSEDTGPCKLGRESAISDSCDRLGGPV